MPPNTIARSPAADVRPPPPAWSRPAGSWTPGEPPNGPDQRDNDADRGRDTKVSQKLGDPAHRGDTPVVGEPQGRGLIRCANTLPATEATVATISDSPRIIRRTWRGVEPIRRSSPSSRRREETTNEKVLATTKIAMKPEKPDMPPNIDVMSSTCMRVCMSPGARSRCLADRGDHLDGQCDQGDAEEQRDEDRRTGRCCAARCAGSGRGASSFELVIFAAICAALPCWRLPTSWPSSRKITEWAYDAATGSWVTIAMVWPCSSTDVRSSSSTWRLVVRSRAPVGSSAK